MYSNIILVIATMYIKTYIANSAPPIITGLVRPCSSIWYVHINMEAVAQWYSDVGCRVKGHGFNPFIGTFFLLFSNSPSPFPISLFSLSFFFSPPLLFSYKLSPPLQCSSIFYTGKGCVYDVTYMHSSPGDR